MSFKVCSHLFSAKLYVSYMKPLHRSGNCILKMILVDRLTIIIFAYSDLEAVGRLKVSRPPKIPCTVRQL